MFTGIVEEMGSIRAVKRNRNSAMLVINAEKVLENTSEGDSISVNGICLTVTSMGQGFFSADVMHETMNRSSLSRISPGDSVNLERAMAAYGRFGGHIVSGHVDGTGTIKDIRRDENAVWFTISAKPEILEYIVEKGSVALDGISLTVANVRDEDFDVSVIPHTLTMTVLSKKRPGDIVNIENDVIGKYVKRFLTGGESGKTGGGTNRNKGITEEMLMEYGF